MTLVRFSLSIYCYYFSVFINFHFFLNTIYLNTIKIIIKILHMMFKIWHSCLYYLFLVYEWRSVCSYMVCVIGEATWWLQNDKINCLDSGNILFLNGSSSSQFTVYVFYQYNKNLKYQPPPPHSFYESLWSETGKSGSSAIVEPRFLNVRLIRTFAQPQTKSVQIYDPKDSDKPPNYVRLALH